MPNPHPTLILMHNPQALRTEYVVDHATLKLWWSPLAGESFDYRDRNFSSRDDHLNIFERISFPELREENFAGCDYDPYHSIARYAGQRLHLATLADQPILLVWGEKPLTVDFKTERYDTPISQTDDRFVVAHSEPGRDFTLIAATGEGNAKFQHSPLIEDGRAIYSRIRLEAGQTLAIGVGLKDSKIVEEATAAAGYRNAALARTNGMVDLMTEVGRWNAPSAPLTTRLRDTTVRSLHSCIDDSGALRASIKDIYYLIWIRDSAFCFGYQAAAGWGHRLGEWCRFLLENPLHLNEPGLPGKMFGQLVSKKFGKLEEDGIYYAVWSTFTHWTQTGEPTYVANDFRKLQAECMDAIENYIFDPARGLFGEHFADESPTFGARDCFSDSAIGKPSHESGLKVDGQAVERSYDIYINLLLHAAWTMLAASAEEDAAQDYTRKATQLWEHLSPFFADLGEEELPPYGELLLTSGERTVYGPLPTSFSGKSVYVWALSLPTFAPIPNIDGIRRKLLTELLREPDGHWINGICAVIASLDTWVCPEKELVEAIEAITRQSWRAGPYMPMEGAMPEKFDAPFGHIHHDIRPQAFAQSSWLAACTNLGVRRLPYGLSVRPTQFFATLEDFAWRGQRISFVFNAKADSLPVLDIGGKEVRHTLQLPEGLLTTDTNQVEIRDGGAQPLLVRSTVELQTVEPGATVVYTGKAYGLSELVFDETPATASLIVDDEKVEFQTVEQDGMTFLRFTARGNFRLEVTAS